MIFWKKLAFDVTSSKLLVCTLCNNAGHKDEHEGDAVCAQCKQSVDALWTWKAMARYVVQRQAEGQLTK